MSRIFSRETFLWLVAVIVALVALAIIVPPFFSPAPMQAPIAQLAQNTPTPTRTPGLATVALPPTPSYKPQTIVPLPTSPAQAKTFTFAVDPSKSGWIFSDDLQVHWNDRNLHAGTYRNQSYQSILYFDVSALPPGTQILYADLQITGFSRENLRGSGTWNLELLPTTMLDDWSQHSARDFSNAIPQATIGAALGSEQLNDGQVNQFTFSSEQRALLGNLLETHGDVGFRIDGLNSSYDNLFTWDLGGAQLSVAPPTLSVVAIPGQYVVVTRVPTPGNVLTAAAQIVQATQVSARFGTPTPLPRKFVTPAPFPSMTATPQSVNAATATAQSIYATAVALTTGTFTPAPPTFATLAPSPTPAFVTAGQFTPVVQTTPTVQISRWALYQTPFPSELGLSGDILFLTNRESTGPNASQPPTVYAMRPDGTVLGKLTSFDLWQSEANRGLFAPDGRRYLDVARDSKGLWMIVLVDQSGTITPLIQEPDNAKGLGAYDPIWSPQGDKIVFSSGRAGNQELYLYDVPTKAITRLTFTSTPASDYAPSSKRPSWSPDGKQIVYWSDGYVNPPHLQLYIYDFSTGVSRNISNNMYDDWNPVWVRK